MNPSSVDSVGACVVQMLRGIANSIQTMKLVATGEFHFIKADLEIRTDNK